MRRAEQKTLRIPFGAWSGNETAPGCRGGSGENDVRDLVAAAAPAAAWRWVAKATHPMRAAQGFFGVWYGTSFWKLSQIVS